VSRRHKYNIAFKLEVVRYAKEHGNRATERNFGPPPTEMMIRHATKMARLRRKLENMDIGPKKLGFGGDNEDDNFGSKKEKPPNGIHVIVQPKGWMDGEGVKVWLDKVWSKYPVCEWVLKSWCDIKTKVIFKSFKKCGISNAMDGTEDNLLYETDSSHDDDDSSSREDSELGDESNSDDFSGFEDQ
ncbi:putative Pogo transposable element-like 94, partial [Homarus americanus]